MRSKVNQVLLYSNITITTFVSTVSITPAYAAWFPHTLPRTQAEGSYASRNNQLIGDIDSLLPVYGNNDGFLFGDVTGRYSSNSSWLASPGIGIRRIHNNQLFGLYGFADYQQTNPKARFWVINPGLEWMTPVWDAHINGYLPTNRDKSVGPDVIASAIGNNTFLRFEGHGQTDAILVPTVAIGRGLDAQVGYSVDLKGYRGRLFGGGYYYGQKHTEMKNLKGAMAGVQLPLNQFADVMLTDSYDNLNHNRVALTLRMTWGGNRTYSRNIQDRLLDRIERHAGLIDTGAGSISQRELVNTGRRATLVSNIWFFVPGSTPPGFVVTAHNDSSTTLTAADCTIDHPCDNFGQSAVNDIQNIAPNALFYMAPGNYSLSTDLALNIYSGQSVYGRTSSYAAPAIGTMRALLIGGLQAQGNNIFDSLRIQNNGVVTNTSPTTGEGIAALYLPSTNVAQMVTVRNSALEANAAVGNMVNPVYTSGIVTAGGALTVQNSTVAAINISTTTTGSRAIGLHGFGGASVDVKENSVVLAQSSGDNALGVFFQNASTLSFTNSMVSSFNTGANQARGITLESSAFATMNGSKISATSSGTFATAVYVDSARFGLINNSSVVALNTGTGQARSVSMLTASTGTARSIGFISDADIMASAAGFSVGLGVSAGDLTINQSNVVSTSTANNSRALQIQEASDVTSIDTNFSTNNVSPAASLAIGVTLSGAGTKLDMTRGIISANKSGLTGQALGISMFTDTPDATLTNVTINATAMGSGTSTGMRLANSSKATVTNSTITSNTSGSNSIGLSNNNTSTISFTGGNVNVTEPNGTPSIRGGNNTGGISFNGTECTLNGVIVTCSTS